MNDKTNFARDVLIAARKLIEKPENWTQGAFARDCNGIRVSARSSEAVCWCAYGALASVAGTPPYAPWSALKRAIDDIPVSAFNDTHTHAEVLAAFDRAIEFVS